MVAEALLVGRQLAVYRGGNLGAGPTVVVAVKAILFAAWAVVGLAPVSALAGELFRCKGKTGETAFTSSRAGYTDCKLIKTFADPVATAPALGASAPAPSQGKVEFRTAAGAAEPAPAADPAQTAKVTRGAVYKYVKDGVTHYTNRRPSGVRAAVLFSYIESCFACSVRSSVDFHSVSLNLDAYASEIAQAAETHAVDPAFLRAVIHAESAFNANALSHKGAQGLMQLMPDTAERFGVDNPFEAAQNIGGGAKYLAWLLKRFNGDARLAAAGYNAGEGAVDRFGGVPPYDETQVFVERVGILHQRYRSAVGLASSGASTGTAGAR